MKVRIGFVSNSSSSSFLIGFKGELTKECVLEALEVKPDSPMFNIALSLATYIVNHAEDLDEEDIEDGYFEDEIARCEARGMQVLEISVPHWPEDYNQLPSSLFPEVNTEKLVIISGDH